MHIFGSPCSLMHIFIPFVLENSQTYYCVFKEEIQSRATLFLIKESLQISG